MTSKGENCSSSGFLASAFLALAAALAGSAGTGFEVKTSGGAAAEPCSPGSSVPCSLFPIPCFSSSISIYRLPSRGQLHRRPHFHHRLFRTPRCPRIAVIQNILHV